jgi:hypothetical protein
MAKAGGIVGGVILLLIGLLVGGAGFGGLPAVNSFVLDPQVPVALQMLRDEGSAMVEDEVPGQLTGELKTNRDDALPMIQTMFDSMLPLYTGDVLTQIAGMILGEVGAENLAYLVNGSVSYMLLMETLLTINASVLDWDTTLEMFFNMPNFQVALGTPMMGVSEWATGGLASINVPEPSHEFITAGNMGAPGILVQDMGDGTPGIIGFLMLGATQPATAMAAYQIDAGNLTAIMGYITMHLFPLVPAVLASELGFVVPAATAATAPTYITLQWATKFLMPTGFPLPIGLDGVNIVGWESGAPMTLAQAQNLWDSGNVNGLINPAGFTQWYAAAANATLRAELAGENLLLGAQADALAAWLVGTTSGMFQPVLKGAAIMGLGIPYDDLLYTRLFLLQWSNMALTEPTILSVDPEITFELQGLTAQMDSDSAVGLWNDTDTHSLTNTEGIKLWIESCASPVQGTLPTSLRIEYGLTTQEMRAIRTWISNLIFIATSGTVIPIDEQIYTRLFLAQWSHLALLGEPLEYEGVTGLEVALPASHAIASDVCLSLWDDTSAYSLTTEKGYSYWLEAAMDPESKIHTDLQSGYGLDDVQMAGICTWIISVRTTVLPKLADALGMVEGLPVKVADAVSFLYDYQYYVGGAGSAVALLGLILAIISGRKK